jgi:hypothetical protein
LCRPISHIGAGLWVSSFAPELEEMATLHDQLAPWSCTD